ncbi:protocatechuate 3,4-dioxygenase subunit beta [Amycolatopsis sp. FDAARGOS 1241]|uniref:protocatechuate 3,4-dioxygenase subunit beta n=1 Tax=Amycolatopsis sp. FDAARGOS 1241 TaxID=2778070 RepID=UPI0019521C3F|nr:protocatechuate 3,4-dioxygenase subunit beta [Amycolatopsis sp. FDAARGOS 1241]QRP44425.1 protocatechuate 3,4-dioxygenase subunit beta [Amycolatopsis sp. FDAARGOS 1241]
MASPTDLRLPRYPREPEGTNAPLDYQGYRSTKLRHPSQPLVLLPQMLTEVTGPLLGPGRLGELDNDLTRQHDGEPQGQRIIVSGRLLDGDGRPIRNSLVEIWQANAGGRYRHTGDRWPSPLDPNFDGLGRALTDDDGRYEFTTIKPGAYPWKNHDNAWRPAHIHFSVFGSAFTQRLVTQMYFPDDPLFSQDPIFNSIPDEKARERMISRFNLERTVPEWAMAFDFDIVVRGREQSVFEDEEDED